MIPHSDRLRALVVRAGSALLVLALGWQASAAPAPLERTTRNRPLGCNDLAGTWTLVWAGHHGTMTLTARGDYVCTMNGLTYVGSWHFDGEGRFCINESPTPHVQESWRLYAIRLCPRSFTGSVEVGCPGVKVSMTRGVVAPVK